MSEQPRDALDATCSAWPRAIALIAEPEQLRFRDLADAAGALELRLRGARIAPSKSVHTCWSCRAGAIPDEIELRLWGVSGSKSSNAPDGHSFRARTAAGFNRKGDRGALRRLLAEATRDESGSVDGP